MPLKTTPSQQTERPDRVLSGFTPKRTFLAVTLPIALASLAIGVAGLPQQAVAQESAAQEAQILHFDIPAGPLDGTLDRFARIAGVNLSYDRALVAGRTSRGLAGQYGVRAGLQALLAGTDIEAHPQVGGGFALKKAVTLEPRSGETTLAPVRVTAGNMLPDQLPSSYAGGRIARGGRVGMLGNKDMMDTPFSITSYTAQAIEDQQATTVMEVLRKEPSVRAVFPEGSPAEYFHVRGFYMNSYEFAWNGLFGVVPQNRAPTEFLERVEVLKGPGALLYGMSLGGTVGGVINLVPKRAADTPLTRLTTSFMSDSRLGLHADVGRRFGTDGQLGVRVNAAKIHGDAGVDDQRQDRALGSVALDFRGERLRASLDVYNMKEKQDGGLPLLVAFASSQIPKAPDPETNTMPGAHSLSRSKGLIGRIDFDVSENWSVFAGFGVKRQTSAGYLNDAIGMNAQPSGNYLGIAKPIRNYFDADSAEAGLRGQFETGAVRHQLVLSANRVGQETGAVATQTTWASNLYAPTKPNLAATPGSPPKQTETVLTGFALADTMSFMDDRYLFTLGLRRQAVESKNYDAAGKVTARYDEHALTPAVGFVAKPWDMPVSLYANYIEGLSQGGRVTDTTAANYGEVFAPYKSKQHELGVKWDAGRSLNTLSLFQITRPSLIRDVASNRYSDDGEQRNRGVEWTTASEVSKGVRLLGGVAYTRAVMTRSAGGALDGKVAYGVPKWQANLGVEWDLPALPGLTLAADAIYTGKQYVDSANTQQLPSWTRFDLGARYAIKVAGRKVVLRGSVVNALDKHYWASIWNSYVAVGAPRTVQVSATVDF